MIMMVILISESIMKPKTIKILAFTPFILWFFMGLGLFEIRLNTILFGLLFYALVSILSYPIKYSKFIGIILMIIISATLYIEGLSNELFGISNYIKFLVCFNLYYLFLMFTSKPYLDISQSKIVYKRLIIKSILIIMIICSLILLESYLIKNIYLAFDNDVSIFQAFFILKIILTLFISTYKVK